MRASLLVFTAALAFATTLSSARTSDAQSPPAPAMGREEITALAKVQIAIGKAHDSVDAELAQSRNKTAQAQAQLQQKLQTQIAEILKASGMTEADFEHKTYMVSTVPGMRQVYDSAVAKITGVPLPGQVVAPASRTAVANLPAGPVGVHIGHVMNAFADTPNGLGLLAVAEADAGVAAQHAALAARTPTNLDAMKLHAGHVIHAIDPTIVTAGPGSGYGVKKAATGVATHIELAAKAPGASQNVIMHSQHVATAARNTVQRGDSLVALAKRVQAATDAAAAAALVNQMVPLAQALMAGADTNGDGRVGWEEGGLQTAEDHVKLMLASEVKPPL